MGFPAGFSMTFLGLIYHFRNNSQRKNPPKLEPFSSGLEPSYFSPFSSSFASRPILLTWRFAKACVISLQDEAAPETPFVRTNRGRSSTSIRRVKTSACRHNSSAIIG
jgi:hypothetical protein